MAERVIVIGAGMAGLWTALALNSTDREILVLERDPPPPDGGPDAAFTDWQRRGVGHLRHSHAFLARLRNLIRDEHPGLLADLQAAGTRDLAFADGLTSVHRRTYFPKPVDEDLCFLTSRRTTLELVMRRYVDRLPNMTLRSSTLVKWLPGLAPWIEPGRAQPTSRVFGMGDLMNLWRELAPGGKPAVLGFFAVGDSLVRTNPLYGRSCSFAAVGASLLREALAESADPGDRLVRFQAKAKAELRPYYVAMRDADRSAIKRARQALTPGFRPSLRRRMSQAFMEDGVTVAIRSDPDLLRAALRGFHMLEHPQAWLKRPGAMVRILGYWARGKRRNAAAYRPKGGPVRAEMMTALRLDAQADIDRILADPKQTVNT